MGGVNTYKFSDDMTHANFSHLFCTKWEKYHNFKYLVEVGIPVILSVKLPVNLGTQNFLQSEPFKEKDTPYCRSLTFDRCQPAEILFKKYIPKRSEVSL